jgi:hypothetical protein
MMIRYAIALAVVLAVAAFVSWAFLPARYLPGNRAGDLRLRLRLRMHPGKEFATVAGLWWRWGRLAAFRRSARLPRQHRVPGTTQATAARLPRELAPIGGHPGPFKGRFMGEAKF